MTPQQRKLLLRFGLGGVLAIAIIAGGAFWRMVTVPVPETPCPTTTLAAIEARGQSFNQSFFTSQYTVEGMLVRGVTGEPGPRCLFFLGNMRCETDGPATVGARLFNATEFFDVPPGRSAAIAVSSGAGIACGLEG